MSADVNQSDDEDDEDADEGAKEKGMVSSFDADPFVSNNSSVASAKEQDGVMIMEGSPEREQLATAIKLAEFALEAIALESDMRKTLADEALERTIRSQLGKSVASGDKFSLLGFTFNARRCGEVERVGF